MEYEEKEAFLREEIVAAGKRLLSTGLVSRTWGNVSARLSETEFIITPSGRDYETTKPEDLVKMNIYDLSYDEDSLKPSSEHGLHAACYRLRPEINFVIHTHQFFASAVGAALKDVTFPGRDLEEVIAPCTRFALPGTKKLWKSVEASVKKNPGSRSFLMARHGALVLAGSPDEAFALAEELEEGCRALFLKKVPEAAEIVSGASDAGYARLYEAMHGKMPPYLDDYAMMTPVNYEVDDEEALAMITEKNGASALYARDSRPMGRADAFRQHRSYIKKYSKLKHDNGDDNGDGSHCHKR